MKESVVFSVVLLFLVTVLLAGPTYAACGEDIDPDTGATTYRGEPCEKNKVNNGDFNKLKAAELSRLQGADLQTVMKSGNLAELEPKEMEGFTAAQMAGNLEALDKYKGHLNLDEYNKALTAKAGQDTQVTPEAKGVRENPSGGISADELPTASVASASHSPITLTNARDVVITPQMVCGGYAEAVMVGVDLHASVQDFCVHGSVVDVKHADEVRVKCADGGPGNGYTWSTAGVSDATFVVDGFVRLNSSTAQDLAVRDCAGNDVGVVLKGLPESRVEFRKDGLEIRIEQANVTVKNEATTASDAFVVQETADATGSAKLTLDRLTKKVSYVDMNPTFTYEFRTGKGTTDFGLKASDVPGKIFIRRIETQSIPEQFRTCKDCAVVDLPLRTITIRGNVDYLRKEFDMHGTVLSGYVAVYHTPNSDAVAKMVLDASFTFVDDLFIMNDAPPITTRVSNFLTVKEERVDAFVGKETHRLVGIDESVEGNDLSQSVIKNYRTNYSLASMVFDNNDVVYKDGTFLVNVFSPLSGKIRELMDNLTATHAALLLSALVIPFARKRGQMAVFIIIGVLVVILVGTVLFMIGGAQRLPVADTSGVNGYVDACLEQSAKESLKFIGAQGGALTAPLTVWFDGKAKPTSAMAYEASLRQDVALRFQRCLNLRERFKGINAVSDAAVNVAVSITASDVVFKVHYPAEVTLIDGTVFTIDDKQSVIPDKLQTSLEVGASVVRSEEAYGMIDLDDMRKDDVTAIFFPYNDQLVTFLRDDVYARLGQQHYVAFASVG